MTKTSDEIRILLLILFSRRSLLVSHCLEIDTKWKHDKGNVLIRLLSLKHRAIHESYDRRWIFSGSNSSFVYSTKIFDMPKLAGRHFEDLFSR